MTRRSSTQQHPKASTISQRLRNRANSNLSAQAPPALVSRRSRQHRVALSPTPRHHPFGSRISQAQPHTHNWEREDTTDHILLDQQSPYRSPESIVSERPLSLQSLDFAPYATLDGSRSVPASSAGQQHTLREFSYLRSSISEISPPSVPSVTADPEFDLSGSTESHQRSESFHELQDMSTIGYMMAPSQYGLHNYGSPSSYSQNYPQTSQHGYAEQRSSTSGSYGSSYVSGATIPHEQRRPDEHSVLPPYQTQQHTLSRSPYQQQQPLSSLRSNSTPLASAGQGYSYPTHGSVPSQPLGSNASSYPPPQLYPPATYGHGVSEYHPLPTMYPPSSTTPAAYPAYGSSTAIPQPPANDIPSLSSSPSAQNSAVMPRILNSRPKPQCWEHGCNGRQFSTFSNLLRHQREKSGTASKSYCPRCGAEFTRTTARNGHMAHDKCKPRRPSDSSH